MNATVNDRTWNRTTSSSAGGDDLVAAIRHAQQVSYDAALAAAAASVAGRTSQVLFLASTALAPECPGVPVETFRSPRALPRAIKWVVLAVLFVLAAKNWDLVQGALAMLAEPFDGLGHRLEVTVDSVDVKTPTEMVEEILPYGGLGGAIDELSQPY